MSSAEYFQRLFAYDHWANGRVLDAIAGLAGKATVADQTVPRMAHVLVCQRLWIQRITRRGIPPETIFPAWTLEETVSRSATISKEVMEFVDELNGDRLHASFSYTTTEGEAETAIVLDVLTQLSQHGCYHRGQVVLELKPHLDRDLNTDYIFYTKI